MSVFLLDVNVLVALLDPAHPNHEDAHGWFGAHGRRGWATCPLTIAGCVRVLSNPAYPTVNATPADVIDRLRIFCGSSHHEFWPDAISLLDERLFRPGMLQGHRQITDVCLLALAIRNKAKLATFDTTIPLKAVRGGALGDVMLLGSSGAS
ncbi:MAG: TA system VapC family ribonuclease toxin [Bryobacteraceae bacterium]